MQQLALSRLQLIAPREHVNAFLGRGVVTNFGWQFKIEFLEQARSEYHLHFGRADDTDAIFVYGLEVDGHGLASLCIRCGEAAVVRYIKDIVLACFVADAPDKQFVSVVSANRNSGIPSPGYSLAVSISGKGIRLVTSVSIELLNVVASALDSARSQFANSRKPNALRLPYTVDFDWGYEAVREVTAWSVGDFLPLSNVVTQKRLGLRLVDTSGFAIASLTQSDRGCMVDRIFDSPLAFCTSGAASVETRHPDLVDQPMTMLTKTNQTSSGAEDAFSSNAVSETETPPLPGTQITVPVSVTLGTARLTLRELEDLRPGQIIDLIENVNSEVSIYVGQQRIAAGKLCDINGMFGVLISRTWIHEN
jgi:flagellar motor switch/type III secretory pathway protein FliN